jgi:hypothetical protein
VRCFSGLQGRKEGRKEERRLLLDCKQHVSSTDGDTAVRGGGEARPGAHLGSPSRVAGQSRETPGIQLLQSLVRSALEGVGEEALAVGEKMGAVRVGGEPEVFSGSRCIHMRESHTLPEWLV